MKILSDTVSGFHKRAQSFAKHITYDVVESLYPSKNNQAARTWAYYLMFAGTCSLIHEAGKAMFPGYTWTKRAVVGTIGGLLQGNPDCPAQQAIEKYPLTGFVAGAINGIGCCWIHPYFSKPIGEQLGSNMLGVFLTSVVIMPAVCRFVMCPIENQIKNIAEYFMSSADQIVSPTSCCAGRS